MIGRVKEQKKLRELYESGENEFVAVYGRRGVGKTYLIDEIFRNRISFRHAGLSPVSMGADDAAKKRHMKEQLAHFYQALLVQGMKSSKAPENGL